MGLLNGLKSLTHNKKAKKTKSHKKSSVSKPSSKKEKSKKSTKKNPKKIKRDAKKTRKKATKTTKKKKIIRKKTPKKKAVKKVKASRKKISKKKSSKKTAAKKSSKKIEAPKVLTHAHAIKLLNRNDSTEFIKNIVGEEGLKVFSYLVRIGKKIDEFTLADKVNLQINFVRSLLYKLYEYKLVSFSRERDKRKGWFIYSWVAHPDKLREELIKIKNEEIVKLKKESLEAQQIFYCNTCKKSYSYTKAMEHMFFCPVCGSPLSALKPDDIQKRINSKINKILKDKNEIDSL